VLFARGAVRWDSRLTVGASLAMGEALGSAATGAKPR
jgi:hypothetical protein